MDISAWGALGEVVGALAVVLSLVYLASQLKDSARIARVQAHQNQTRSSELVMQMLVRYPDAWRRGHAQPDGLAPEELSRFHSLMYAQLFHVADIWQAGRNDAFDDATRDAWMRAAASFVTSEGGEAWWAEARALFIPELVKSIDELRGHVPPWPEVHPGQFVDLASEGSRAPGA